MKKRCAVILLTLLVSAGSASAASGVWNKIFEKNKKSALWKPDGLGTLQIINDQYQDLTKQNNLYKSRNEEQSKIIDDFFTQLGKSYKKEKSKSKEEKSKSKDINNFLCKEAEGLLDKIQSFLSLGGKKGLHSGQHCDDLAVCKIAEDSCENDLQNFKKSKCAEMCEKAQLAGKLPFLISPEEVQNMKTSYESYEGKIQQKIKNFPREKQKEWMVQIEQACKGDYVEKILSKNSNHVNFRLDNITKEGPDQNLDMLMYDDIFEAMVDAQDAASGAKTIEDFKNQYDVTFSQKAVYYANQRKNIKNVQDYVKAIDKIVPAVKTAYFDQKNSMKIQSNVVSARATALLQKIGK